MKGMKTFKNLHKGKMVVFPDVSTHLLNFLWVHETWPLTLGSTPF